MICSFNEKKPQIADSVFVADYVTVIGDVTIGEGSSVWFNTAIRGDVAPIRIGSGVNVQENSVLHVSTDLPLMIEDDVTIGHGCILHSATIRKDALIGMGAIILDGAEIGEGALIGAGTLVPPGKKIPPNVLAVGSPVKVIRELTEEDRVGMVVNAKDYQEKALIYKAMQGE
ncbi:MAG: gamma carbonic anhydrase family protein [Turicibacter sp.]|nr:gamma carbonic anhydrase family protein [Turicibacter sp.]